MNNAYGRVVTVLITVALYLLYGAGLRAETMALETQYAYYAGPGCAGESWWFQTGSISGTVQIKSCGTATPVRIVWEGSGNMTTTSEVIWTGTATGATMTVPIGASHNAIIPPYTGAISYTRNNRYEGQYYDGTDWQSMGIVYLSFEVTARCYVGMAFVAPYPNSPPAVTGLDLGEWWAGGNSNEDLVVNRGGDPACTSGTTLVALADGDPVGVTFTLPGGPSGTFDVVWPARCDPYESWVVSDMSGNVLASGTFGPGVDTTFVTPECPPPPDTLPEPEVPAPTTPTPPDDWPDLPPVPPGTNPPGTTPPGPTKPGTGGPETGGPLLPTEPGVPGTGDGVWDIDFGDTLSHPDLEELDPDATKGQLEKILRRLEELRSDLKSKVTDWLVFNPPTIGKLYSIQAPLGYNGWSVTISVSPWAPTVDFIRALLFWLMSILFVISIAKIIRSGVA